MFLIILYAHMISHRYCNSYMHVTFRRYLYASGLLLLFWGASIGLVLRPSTAASLCSGGLSRRRGLSLRTCLWELLCGLGSIFRILTT